jgi:hypothetical protein
MYDDEEGAAVPVKQPTIEELARIAASYGLQVFTENLPGSPMPYYAYASTPLC